YLLGREGRRVLLLDDGALASGQTERTTAHLSNVIDAGYAGVERVHGKDGARLVAESHTAAILKIEAIVRAERIEADFERLDGYLFLPPGGDRKNRWARLYAPSRRKAGALGEFLLENLNVARQVLDHLRRRPNQELSLVCPHLGCLVNWNDAENTW